MSVPIVCCLLEHVLKQHLYLISFVIFTQRGQYNTPMHMTGCRFSTPVCCLWHIMCVVLATACFNTGSVLLEGWGQHSPHAVLTHNKCNVLKQNNTCCVLNFKQHVPCVISAGKTNMLHTCLNFV